MSRFLDHPRVALVVGLLLGGSGYVAQQADAWIAAWACWGSAILVIAWSGVSSHLVREWVSRRLPFEVRLVWRDSNRPVIPEVDKGFLDYEWEWQKAMNALPGALEEITAETQFQTYQMGQDTKRLEKNVGTSIERRRRVTSGSAQRIERDARRLEGLEHRYRMLCEQMATNGSGLLRTTPSSTDLSPLLSTSAELRDTFIGTRESIRGARQATNEGRKLTVSQDVNRAYERVLVVQGKLVEDADRMVRYCDEARKILLARKLPQQTRAAKRR